MNWLNRFMLANWSHILDALLLLLALLCGMQMGESRVQKAWDAEKQLIAHAQAKQEQHVADVRQSQSQITQEISREFAKKSKLLADRQPDSRAGGVCNLPAAGGGDLSAVSEASERAAPTRSDPLLAPQGDAGVVSCEQLSKDAAQTTLMLMEVQRWYRYFQGRIQDVLADQSNPVESIMAESEALESILAKEFGRPVAQAMRTMMRTGKLSGEVGDDLHDFFIDAIVNDSSTAWSGLINSSGEDWPIKVQEYFGVFYVWAMEYDNVGYFLSREDALSYVFSEGSLELLRQ